MARPMTSPLQALLDLGSCNTQTTLSLYPVSGSPVHIATDAFNADGKDFTADLRKTDDIRQTIGATPDRVNVQIQNVDKAFGLTLSSESLAKATAVVGRFFRKENDLGVSEWRELFRGQAVPIEILDGSARIEVLHDLVAAGYCVAAWSLGENCQLVYKHAGTCGFTGADPTCNKKRKSLQGCAGKIVTGTTTNEYRFGGMEFPDVQVPEPPSGGTGGGGGVGHPTCPRLDQWVRVRGRGWLPVPKQVGKLTVADELYHPIWKTFHAIGSAVIIPGQRIWGIVATNFARGYSSFSHPVFPDRKHSAGIPVSRVAGHHSLLTWNSGELSDTSVGSSFDTGKTGDVMEIKMADGHVYCYSDTPDGPYIVCHNSKPIAPDLL
ncbi:MAG: hypothetical protein IT174_10825 [Acidobacteria bacterium]|nr:hypothetical protein [Acidobacteriota bacterium]